MNVNVDIPLYITRGWAMIAIRILVMALLAIIILGGVLIYKSDDSDFHYVRCVDCANWDGKQCDLDESYCGTFFPEDYESILNMPFYKDKSCNQKTKTQIKKVLKNINKKES